MLEIRQSLAFGALTGFIVFILYRGISCEAHGSTAYDVDELDVQGASTRLAVTMGCS